MGCRYGIPWLGTVPCRCYHPILHLSHSCLHGLQVAKELERVILQDILHRNK